MRYKLDLNQLSAMQPLQPLQPQENHVVITDIKMRFSSMIIFMVKWAFASIPAIYYRLAHRHDCDRDGSRFIESQVIRPNQTLELTAAD